MIRETRHEAPHHALRSALREGDPAADGREPAPDEVARLRARVLDAALDAGSERDHLLHPHCVPEGGGRWTPAAVAAALLLLMIAGAVVVRFDPGGTAERRLESADEPGGEIDTAGPEGRQIQFTTPGGTRVVWMLYPDDQDPSGRAERGSGGRS